MAKKKKKSKSEESEVTADVLAARKYFPMGAVALGRLARGLLERLASSVKASKTMALYEDSFRDAVVNAALDLKYEVHLRREATRAWGHRRDASLYHCEDTVTECKKGRRIDFPKIKPDVVLLNPSEVSSGDDKREYVALELKTRADWGPKCAADSPKIRDDLERVSDFTTDGFGFMFVGLFDGNVYEDVSTTLNGTARTKKSTPAFPDLTALRWGRSKHHTLSLKKVVKVVKGVKGVRGTRYKPCRGRPKVFAALFRGGTADGIALREFSPGRDPTLQRVICAIWKQPRK